MVTAINLEWRDHEPHFLRLLAKDDFVVLHALYEVVKGKDQSYVTEASVKYFGHRAKNSDTSLLLELIKSTIDKEIENTCVSTTLFRSNSVGSKILSYVMKKYGSEYARTVLSKEIKFLCSSHPLLELDPLRCPLTLEKTQARLKDLKMYCDKFLTSILHSVQDCPTFLRSICSHLQRSVARSFPNDTQIQNFSPVAGLLFLRFFCPAISSPKLFGLFNGEISKSDSRNLLLISKVLQNLSTGSTFLSEQAYMQGMNTWLHNNFSFLFSYFRDICKTDESVKKMVRIRSRSLVEVKKMINTGHIDDVDLDSGGNTLFTGKNSTGSGSGKIDLKIKRKRTSSSLGDASLIICPDISRISEEAIINRTTRSASQPITRQQCTTVEQEARKAFPILPLADLQRVVDSSTVKRRRHKTTNLTAQAETRREELLSEAADLGPHREDELAKIESGEFKFFLQGEPGDWEECSDGEDNTETVRELDTSTEPEPNRSGQDEEDTVGSSQEGEERSEDEDNTLEFSFTSEGEARDFDDLASKDVITLHSGSGIQIVVSGEVHVVGGDKTVLDLSMEDLKEQEVESGVAVEGSSTAESVDQDGEEKEKKEEEGGKNSADVEVDKQKREDTGEVETVGSESSENGKDEEDKVRRVVSGSVPTATFQSISKSKKAMLRASSPNFSKSSRRLKDEIQLMEPPPSPKGEYQPFDVLHFHLCKYQDEITEILELQDKKELSLQLNLLLDKCVCDSIKIFTEESLERKNSSERGHGFSKLSRPKGKTKKLTFHSLRRGKKKDEVVKESTNKESNNKETTNEPTLDSTSIEAQITTYMNEQKQETISLLKQEIIQLTQEKIELGEKAAELQNKMRDVEAKSEKKIKELKMNQQTKIDELRKALYEKEKKQQDEIKKLKQDNELLSLRFSENTKFTDSIKKENKQLKKELKELQEQLEAQKKKVITPRKREDSKIRRASTSADVITKTEMPSKKKKSPIVKRRKGYKKRTGRRKSSEKQNETNQQ